MTIQFNEQFDLSIEEVFSYFQTPAEWVRLYGLAGNVDDRGNGWIAVPLKSFPFPLVARNTLVEQNKRVRWMFKGFWRGEGEIQFSIVKNQVSIHGFETISIRWLGFLSPLVEKLFLEKKFNRFWELGWRRLRRSK